jgi:ligand-binding sensor domain-containing protein
LKNLLLLLALVLPAFGAGAQLWTARTYTVFDGLPANNLYGMVRDARGFIWLGSENGLVRFDGNRFRQYRIPDGLPDNEIVELCIDGDGAVWALPYRKPPVRYNPLTDRFESGGQLAIGPENRMNALAGGGMALNASNGKVTIIRHGTRRTLDLSLHHSTAFPPLLTIATGPDKYLVVSADSLRAFSKGRRTSGQRALQPYNAHTLFINNTLFCADSTGIYKSTLNAEGKVIGLAVKPPPFHATRICFTGSHLALISDNGTAASLIDTATLTATVSLPLDGALAGNALEDGEGHIWIATIGQGLLRLSQDPVISYNHLLPPDMSPGAIAIDGPTFLCGDNKGRIVIFKSGCVEKIINISRWSKAISRIRNILVLKDGYYIAVEGDASLLLDKQYDIVSVYNRPLLNYSDRCAALWRDSIILAGSHDRAVRVNYKACRGYDSVPIRTTAIGADDQGRLLIGTSEGCYRKDDTGLYDFGKHYRQFSRRVTDICPTPDGLIWIGLASDYIAAIRGDAVAGIIRIGGAIPGNVCNTLCAGRDGQLWVGTDKSLSRVSYSFGDGRLRWQATAFGPMDGLHGQVNDIAWQHDSVYIATTSGLYTLPANTSPVVRDIPVYITGIRINDRDTVLKSRWELPHDMNDLDIQFAGIDADGYGPAYQYRINREAWQAAGDGHLMLNRLSPGSYHIEIRALKRDGTPSPGTASLQLYLRTPFWLSSWFWLALFFILLGAAALLLQGIFKRKREKQLRLIAAEHELISSQQQTFSALMNPHFIFNALNSIQHYVLVHDKRAANRYLSGFGRLIRMNFESAQKSYIGLEEELERLQLYLSLEQMRFGDRLSHSIEIDEDVAPEDWQIPAMIIQPYLENALLHGITPARIKGQLHVRISRQGENLLVSICDNGIGIPNSLQLRQQNGHVSRSMELIRKRIAILQKLHRQTVVIETGPCSDDELYPGTKVVMTFPGHFAG